MVLLVTHSGRGVTFYTRDGNNLFVVPCYARDGSRLALHEVSVTYVTVTEVCAVVDGQGATGRE